MCVSVSATNPTYVWCCSIILLLAVSLISSTAVSTLPTGARRAHTRFFLHTAASEHTHTQTSGISYQERSNIRKLSTAMCLAWNERTSKDNFSFKAQTGWEVSVLTWLKVLGYVAITVRNRFLLWDKLNVWHYHTTRQVLVRDDRERERVFMVSRPEGETFWETCCVVYYLTVTEVIPGPHSKGACKAGRRSILCKADLMGGDGYEPVSTVWRRLHRVSGWFSPTCT